MRVIIWRVSRSLILGSDNRLLLSGLNSEASSEGGSSPVTSIADQMAYQSTLSLAEAEYRRPRQPLKFKLKNSRVSFSVALIFHDLLQIESVTSPRLIFPTKPCWLFKSQGIFTAPEEVSLADVKKCSQQFDFESSLGHLIFTSQNNSSAAKDSNSWSVKETLTILSFLSDWADIEPKQHTKKIMRSGALMECLLSSVYGQ